MFLLALALQAPAAPSATDAVRAAMDAFRERAAAGAHAYEAAQEASMPLLREGKLDEAIALMLRAVPEKERTPEQAFLLGNMLFDLAPEVSARLHEEAWRALPAMPPVAYEWALQHHRAGRHREAEDLYAGLVAGEVFAAPPVHALRADCLLHLGRHADAVQSWKQANGAQHHTEIEEAVCWIYGPSSPYARRCAMLARAAKGEAKALEEAVLLDLAFDRDWWNVERQEEFLAHDLALAKKAFGETSARWKELDLLVRAKTEMRGADPLQDMLRKMRKDGGKAFDLAGEAAKVGVWGENARLPVSSIVASNLFELFTSNQIANEAELGRRFEKELRARGEAGDVEALEVLAAIYSATADPKLVELDRLGWERHKDVRFGGSLLAARADEVKLDDPLLLGLRALPRMDAGVERIAYGAAAREKRPLVEPIARIAMAEFQRMVSYVEVNAAMRELERELAKKK